MGPGAWRTDSGRGTEFMANGRFWRSVTGLASVQTAGISHLTGTAGISVIYKTCRRKVGV